MKRYLRHCRSKLASGGATVALVTLMSTLSVPPPALALEPGAWTQCIAWNNGTRYNPLFTAPAAVAANWVQIPGYPYVVVDMASETDLAVLKPISSTGCQTMPVQRQSFPGSFGSSTLL